MAARRYDIYFVTHEDEGPVIAKGPYAGTAFDTVQFLNRRGIYTVDPGELEADIEIAGWRAVFFYDQRAVVVPGDPTLDVGQIANLPTDALEYLGMVGAGA